MSIMGGLGRGTGVFGFLEYLIVFAEEKLRILVGDEGIDHMLG